MLRIWLGQAQTEDGEVEVAVEVKVEVVVVAALSVATHPAPITNIDFFLVFNHIIKCLINTRT